MSTSDWEDHDSNPYSFQSGEGITFDSRSDYISKIIRREAAARHFEDLARGFEMGQLESSIGEIRLNGVPCKIEITKLSEC